MNDSSARRHCRHLPVPVLVLFLSLPPLGLACSGPAVEGTTTTTRTTTVTTVTTKGTAHPGATPAADEKAPEKAPEPAATDADAAVHEKPATDGGSEAHAKPDAGAKPTVAAAAPGAKPKAKRASAAKPPGGMVRTTQEYFDTLGQRFVAKAAAGVHGVIQFELSGDQAVSYHVSIDDGKMKLAKGVTDKPDTTIKMKGEDYVLVVNNKMNGTAAVMRGAMKVGGDLTLARKMSSMFPSGALR